MAAALKVLSVTYVKFSRIVGPRSRISEILVPDFFLGWKYADEITAVVDSLQICEMHNGKMVPVKKKKKQSMAEIIQHSPSIVLGRNSWLSVKKDSIEELIYEKWDGNMMQPKPTDYAFGQNTALKYVNHGRENPCKYFELLHSKKVGHYNSWGSERFQLFLIEELNRLKGA